MASMKDPKAALDFVGTKEAAELFGWDATGHQARTPRYLSGLSPW